MPIFLPPSDQAEIDIAIASYNRGIDSKDRELYLSAFHPDAVVVSSRGGEKVTDSAREFFDIYWSDPGRAALRYGTHNYGYGLVTSFEPDRIERWASITFLPHPERVDEAGFQIRAGETCDTFVRVDGHWRFLIKNLTFRAAQEPSFAP